MASYPPPTENLPIFDDIVFQDLGDEFLTYNDAKKYFLQFPNAQGTENLQAINVAGLATFNNNIDAKGAINRFGDFDGISNLTYLSVDDTTAAITANTGSMAVSASGNLTFTSTASMAFGDLNGLGNGTKITTDDISTTIDINASGLTRIGEVSGNNSKITFDPANQKMTLQASQEINLSTFNQIKLGDYAGSSCYGLIDIANQKMTLQAAQEISLSTFSQIKLGDYAGSSCYGLIDLANQNIDLYSATGAVSLISPTTIGINASPSGTITLFTAGDIRIGNVSGAGNQNVFTINPTKATLKTSNGFQLLDSNIQYPSSYRTTALTLTSTTNYLQTFNGSSITATLPIVDGNNVGTQFLITNTNATALTVASSGSPLQAIYSTVSPSSATSRTLATGHSHIFTAIRTTATNAYGWSMV